MLKLSTDENELAIQLNSTSQPDRNNGKQRNYYNSQSYSMPIQCTFEVDVNLNTEIAHSTSATPALFSVCKNARAEAKKTYHELCIFGEGFTRAVIDYEKDTLFLNTNYATNGLLRNAEQALWMSKCRNLALSEQFIFSLQPMQNGPFKFLSNFESIETLSSVPCDWLQSCDGCSVAAGTGNVHFAEPCRHSPGANWRAKILKLKIYLNDNIKDVGRVVAASRAAADLSSLVSENQHPTRFP